MLKRSVLINNLFVVIMLISGCHNKEEINDLLWYKQPAKNWEDAMPLGNGKIGVMVFGKPINEQIQLNDDSMWPGDSGKWKEPEGTKEDLEEIRKLLFEGKKKEANDLIVDKFSRKDIVRSHQTLGDLYIDFDHENITDYRRELDISKALTTVSYKTNGELFTERVLVSHPHKAIVIHLKSQSNEGINARLELSRPTDNGYPTVKTFTNDKKYLIMQGEVTQRGGVFNSEPAPILSGVKFQTCLKINNKGGQVNAGEDYIELQGAAEATLYIVSNSSYYFSDYIAQNIIDIDKVSSMSYQQILAEHISDYQNLYNRCDLKLNSNEQLDRIPTDKRLERVKDGNIDTGLEALLFQYGRYLLISSSRPGTNPANLQGVWNNRIEAPWNSDYHLNINLQMNYWLADVTGLGELNYPLFDYVDKLVENGKVTAEKNFGCDGSFIPHATDLWTPTWMRSRKACWGSSFAAGGWLMQHYWQHYEYTKDEKFLKERTFPVMEQVVRFYSDWLIEDSRDGSLISAPSTSPENSYIDEKGEVVAVCLGSAIDQQVIEEVFENFIKACSILKIENEFVDKVKEQKNKLRSGIVLGTDGRILEWDREYKEYEPGHRHMSHLYAFFPGTEISIMKDPELLEAVRKTMDYRLEQGGDHPGWSRAWLMNCCARLLDGEMTHEHIQKLLKKTINKNLLGIHPPFQIDGNFGYSAGIAEMLLQSHEGGVIRVLPALPSAWEKGKVKGLKARGGLTVDISWKESVLEKIRIKSDFNQTFDLVYKDKKINMSLKKGEVFTSELIDH